MSEREELQSRIYDSLVAFNGVACWDILRLAQMRQYLAEHLADTFAEQAAEIDRLRAELAQAIQHRDHWHAEVKCADARITELTGERDEHRAAAERAEAKLRKIEHGCETPESHNYGCPCETQQAGESR